MQAVEVVTTEMLIRSRELMESVEALRTAMENLRDSFERANRLVNRISDQLQDPEVIAALQELADGAAG